MNKKEIRKKVVETFHEVESFSHEGNSHSEERDSLYYEGYCDALAWVMRLLNTEDD